MLTDQQFEGRYGRDRLRAAFGVKPIFQGENRPWLKFCQRFTISADIDDPLATRVFDWFNKLYGDRLNVDFAFGGSLVLIRGDAFRLRCFRFYGKVCIVCSAKHRGGPIVWMEPEGQVRVVNLLEDPGAFIEGLTPELADRLTDSDEIAEF